MLENFRLVTVYLKLQPYLQHTMKKQMNQKPSLKFFGPYVVKAQVRKVAYRLKLQIRSRIHPTFHVSQHMKHISKAPTQASLPLVRTDEALLKEPIRVVDKRMVKKGNQVATKVLVEWANTFPEDVT